MQNNDESSSAENVTAQDQAQELVEDQKVPGYSWYALGVLVLVYVLNFIDRNILSILANDIKADLGLTDADLGFLYGTAFGVFYALFGIPLGRLADSWHRVKLMTAGLALWSAMTALSGFAKSGLALGAARIGVGVGEATASPSAYSLISDWFPKKMRGTALAIYSAGLYIGGGVSLLIGGLIVEKWNAAYPGGGPLDLVGWQAAFLAVGVPGLLLAIWVFTLREPVRGQMDRLPEVKNEKPFRGFATELFAVIPPFTFMSSAQRGGASARIAWLAMGLVVFGLAISQTSQLLESGVSAPLAIAGYAAALAGIGLLLYFGRVPFALNFVAAVVTAGLAWLIGSLTGNFQQWIALGIGYYAVFSWAVSLRHRDLPTFKLIWGSPAFLYTILGYGMVAFASYSVSFWAAPYAERVLGASKSVLGFWIGGGGALGGFLGVIIGGRVSDWLRERNPGGRLMVVAFGVLAPVIPLIFAFTTENVALFYFLNFVLSLFGSSALGAAAATTQDLVLPRMRGTATATFFLSTTLVGLALGPYMAGQVSTMTGSLSTGVLSMLVVAPIGTVLLYLAYRTVPEAERTVLERARAAGEQGV
ncbi:MFS transporter [Pontixanthobacter aestiaquae]|uniref:MFS transporter n=1 Tax=Pontixanthobacter aestiaquae TaxID=1509367 RepID=A0A844Z551_9SPHN|nr:MFS transporter [Pontixanthobacter aestiaquae]MDN3647072.1 MFS transporter [Pontixanthobacter aestiaquae]MXO81950.1 MFS transporter [Pontixanthobacter aestiaquae]